MAHKDGPKRGERAATNHKKNKKKRMKKSKPRKSY